MYIARLALITLVTFAFLVGCGMVGQKAEMSEEAAMPTDGESINELAVPTPKDSSYQEVTLTVEGMT